jgi:hypothetical protein
MWAAKRENPRGGFTMDPIEIFQVVFLIIIFAVGLIGFMKAATKED